MFEPDCENNSKTTNVVATCGGYVVCIFDVTSGIVVMEYKHKDVRECFYTLAWSTLTIDGYKSNILASGGIKGEIKLYHPRNKVCYYSWNPVNQRNIAVNSLVFHSSQTSWLFCATSDGVVSLWDVGIPTLPTYEGCVHNILLKLSPDYGDIYNIAWSGHESKWLLAGSAAGLVGWNIEVEEVMTGRRYQPMMVDFILPVSDKDQGENPVVDSVAVVTEWSVVTKCAAHGLLNLWDLKTTTATINPEVKRGTVIEKEVTLLSKLKWSETDNFFMNIGCHKRVGLVVCGDDQGSLWLYDMSTRAKTWSQPMKDTIMEPNTRILWPDVQDDHSKNPGKCDNIMVNKVAITWDSKFIVEVTSTNLVCVWRKEDIGAM